MRTIAGAKQQQSRKNGASVEADETENSDEEGGAHRSDVTEPPEKPESEVMGSESEMSVVLDEEPANKESKKRKATTKTKTKAKTKTQTRKSRPGQTRDGDGGEDDLPAQSEIKRLQSCLIKCGVRKMWHKELSLYATPKAKIGHLRGLLKDVGMPGRFSAEKAKRIKAHRELEAEVDDLQAEVKRRGVGKDTDDGDQGGSVPKRRKLARGLRDLDLLGESGREESD